MIKLFRKEIPDVNTQIQMLKQGDIDIALGIGVDNVSQLKDQERREDQKLRWFNNYLPINEPR